MMKQSKRKQARSAACLMVSLLLAACDGGVSNGDGISSAAGTPVSGIAAVGAPIVNGSVILRCDNSWSQGTTTASDGSWQINVPSADLPCAVKVTPSGTPAQSYYSIASGTGSTVTANVSPLTSLALAKAGIIPNETWFNGLNGAGLQTAADALAAAVTALNSLLAGYTLPADFNPFTTALHPATAGDAYDALLEQFSDALGSDSFDDLLASVAGGGDLPPATTTPTSTDVTGPLSAPASSTYTEFFINLAGEYKLEVTEASAGGENIFNVGDVVSVKIQNAGPPYSITYTEKSGGAIKTRKFDTNASFHKEGSGATATDVLDIKGQFSSDGALQVRYQPSTGHLILYFSGFYGSTHEGLATLETRANSSDSTGNGENDEGTGSTGGTSPGPLSDAIANVYAGDYSLVCGGILGVPKKTFSFTINPDGISTLQGEPLVDVAHPGTYKLERGSDGGNGTSLTIAPKTGSNYVVLGWKADGTFYPNSVYYKDATAAYGTNYACYANTGHTAPANSGTYVPTNAAAALARSETLNCSPLSSTDTTPETLSINSDGSAQLGTLSVTKNDIFHITHVVGTAAGKKNALEYSGTLTGSSNSLMIELDSALKTTGVLAATGTGPNDILTCTP